jgi:hypothetical protein
MYSIYFLKVFHLARSSQSTKQRFVADSFVETGPVFIHGFCGFINKDLGFVPLGWVVEESSVAKPAVAIAT